MMLFKKVPIVTGCNKMYPNQDEVQRILALTAFICVPWLFMAKTSVLLQKKKFNSKEESSEYGIPKSEVRKYEEPETMAEIVINQGIKTTEFVLGDK